MSYPELSEQTSSTLHKSCMQQSCKAHQSEFSISSRSARVVIVSVEILRERLVDCKAISDLLSQTSILGYFTTLTWKGP